MINITRRFFFNYFKRKREYKVEVIDLKNKNEKKFEDNKTQDSNIEISEFEKKKLKYYNELKQQRELFEKEYLKNKKEIDYGNIRAEREYDVTIRHLNVNKLIIDNINIFPSDDFKNYSEFMYYFEKNNFLLDQENTNKILKGFLNFADKITDDDLKNNQFQIFLDNLRQMIYIIKDEEILINLVRFLDIYCVDYKELWVKIESKLLNDLKTYSNNCLVNILIHFGNQKEGSEEFFLKIENYLTPKLNEFNLKEIINIFQSFYNTKYGTKLFGDDLLNITINLLKDLEFSSENIRLIVKICLIIKSVDNNFEIKKANIFKAVNNYIFNHNDFNFEECCLLAQGISFEHGYKDIYSKLENMALNHIKIEDMNFDNFHLFIKGFLFNYLISDKNLNLLIDKFYSFQYEFEINDLMKIKRSFYIMEIEDKNLYHSIESIIIYIFRNNMDILTPQNLFEIALSYGMTRKGTRELYKLLEYIISLKINEISKDSDLLRKIYLIYENSGLCSESFILQLKKINIDK